MLVSSLVDLEAEEGKNLSLSRAAVGAEGGAGPSQGPALLCRTSCHRFGEQFCSPRPLPGVSVCVGPCWGLHPWGKCEPGSPCWGLVIPEEFSGFEGSGSVPA